MAVFDEEFFWCLDEVFWACVLNLSVLGMIFWIF